MKSRRETLSVALLLCTTLIVCCGEQRTGRAEGQEPEIVVNLNSSRVPQSFEAVRLPQRELDSLKVLETTGSGFSEVLAVYVVDRDTRPPNESVPPISGKYVIEGNRLRFTPRHPLRPGFTYRVVLKIQNSSDQAEKSAFQRDVTVPASSEVPSEPAFVTATYPSSDHLPENHLRFYIHFSNPMSRHEAYRNLELLDDAGNPIEAAFLELGEELWDPAARRFTLLLDPGRVKQGLKPREELGPVLKSGARYTLIVKQNWHDENGNRLKAEFRKSFITTPASEAAIGWNNWKLIPPIAKTNEPLTVEFDRGLDHALLARMLKITDLEGRSVSGRILIGSGETKWSMTPDEVWKAGSYFLVIDSDLEDPCGNRIDRSFEVVQSSKAATAETSSGAKRIRFDVRDAINRGSANESAGN